MNESSSPTHETLQGALFDADALLSGQSREFDVDGRTITVARTPEGPSVVSENQHAVVIRPVGGGAYAVTGARDSSDRPEEASYAAAVRIALERLARAAQR